MKIFKNAVIIKHFSNGFPVFSIAPNIEYDYAVESSKAYTKDKDSEILVLKVDGDENIIDSIIVKNGDTVKENITGCIREYFENLNNS